MQPKLTLVTGATGFVGAAVARELEAAGYSLRLMHRAQADLSNLDGLRGQRVIADLRERSSLEAAVAGCDAVFHVAADYRLWVRDPAQMYASNVDGSCALLQAAATAGVHRFVYTSSVATLRAGADGRVADETTPTQLEDMIGHYKRSKFLAEQAVLSFAKTMAMEIVTVKPSTPIGPRDIKPTPTGKVIRDAACGRIPAFVNTGLNIVHVDDVAVGHRLAFERGRNARSYVLGGTDMSLKLILETVAELMGRAPPRVQLPLQLLLPLAYVVEAWSHLTAAKDEPLLTLDGLRMARYQMFYSSARARAELGYEPRQPRLAIADALHWFADHDYLPSAPTKT
jgi:dihydroflavonol-4-reductase